MSEKDIFEHLFAVAAKSKDPRGVVSACLVESGEIIASAASSDDGVRHAEDILFEETKNNGLSLSKNTILYATLEPCNRRTDPTMMDCTNQIIEAGIGGVVFGARDPDQSSVTRERLEAVGIEIKQTLDSEIIKKCAEIFNTSVTEEHVGVDVKLKPEI